MSIACLKWCSLALLFSSAFWCTRAKQDSSEPACGSTDAEADDVVSQLQVKDDCAPQWNVNNHGSNMDSHSQWTENAWGCCWKCKHRDGCAGWTFVYHTHDSFLFVWESVGAYWAGVPGTLIHY
eukprot:TRINITY_DN104014_c0_g1_i1.p1 TRINITY_DN104014_c0_g1~~TRINITY_DN104014_c0_g1_i1.p1  ORF type:complete len:124 (-),score=8.71 TRINITY_DN104014_c0_g1_i1:15-386(-)